MKLKTKEFEEGVQISVESASESSDSLSTIQKEDKNKNQIELPKKKL